MLRIGLAPVGQFLGAGIRLWQRHPGLAPTVKWVLYVLLAFGIVVTVAPYLIWTFTTPEGAQPWRPYGDIRTWIFLANGLLVTLQVSAIAIAASLVIGTLLALGRLSRLPIVRWPAIGYIEIVRALPVFLMIIFVHLQFNRIAAGIKLSLDESWAVVLALTIYTVAVNAEIVRAGITSIDRGQLEAARSLGMTSGQMMAFVVLPQALQRMIPPLVSQFITLLKDTSLGAVIGLLELLRRGEILYRGTYDNRINNNPIETLFIIAVIYFVICYVLSLGSTVMERRWARAT
jgi:His/Glu/Gln/Arg/opine family amino acid ABC transporter permease subunit